MSEIEEIMSQNKDKKNLYEKARELVDYYKSQLNSYSYIQLFEGYKRMKFSKSFSDKYHDVPERCLIALETAMKELMDEKLKKMTTDEMDEFSKYIEKEKQEAENAVKKAREVLDNPDKKTKEEIKKAISNLEQDDNYKRFVVSYTEGNLSQTGETLLNSEFDKVNYNMADFNKKLIDEQKNKLK